MIQRFGRPSRVKNLIGAGFVAVTALLYAFEGSTATPRDAAAAPGDAVEALTSAATAGAAGSHCSPKDV